MQQPLLNRTAYTGILITSQNDGLCFSMLQPGAADITTPPVKIFGRTQSAVGAPSAELVSFAKQFYPSRQSDREYSSAAAQYPLQRLPPTSFLRT
jgi:hypothetical protein